MRDIPGFGIWLAMMTVMSGLVGCGPDKPSVGGGSGGRTPGGDGAVVGGDAPTRPPPVQPVDGASERPPAMTAPTTTMGAATGCLPPATDAAAPPASDAGATTGPRDAGAGGSSSASDAAGDTAGAAGGGRPGTDGGTDGGNDSGTGGGGADATGGRTATPGTGGGSTSGGSGGSSAGGSGGGAIPGTGGARPPASGGAPGSGGARPPAGGGAPGSGGATTTGTGGMGTGGAGGGASSGPAPAPGELGIVELLINPASTDTGREWIEVVNRTTHAISLAGLHIADAANDAAVDFGSGAALLPAGGRAVLVQSADPTKNGGITDATAVVVGTFGTLVSLNNEADTISICAGVCTAGGVAIDKVTWDATLGTGYDGHALVIDDAAKRCPAPAAFGDAGSFGTPGLPNAPCP